MSANLIIYWGIFSGYLEQKLISEMILVRMVLLEVLLGFLVVFFRYYVYLLSLGVDLVVPLVPVTQKCSLLVSYSLQNERLVNGC